MIPGSGSTLSYGFDASSNLTTLPTGATGTYDNAGELASSALSGTATSYTYNADGQRLTAMQGTTTITSGTWNGARQLTAYDDAAADMTVSTYDGTGLRASLSTNTGSQNFTWNTAGSMPQLIMDSAHAYIYAGGLAPVEQVSLSAGTVTYLVADSLGSIRGTVNSSGSLTGTANYDAWGNAETTGGLAGTTPFGFAGGYSDPTGLIYLINRYYDPSTGQFLSPDPLVDQTLLPYAYAIGNPVSNIDPTGLVNWPSSDGTNCEACAKKIQEIIGGKIYKILPKHKHAKSLGPSRQDPHGTYHNHYYVRKHGRAYDAWTGPQGRDQAVYENSWEYSDALDFGIDVGGGGEKCPPPRYASSQAVPNCI